MAFDWGRFADSLEKAGGEFAGRLQYQWQQNQEEERVMREYGAKLKLEDAQKQREEGRRLAQDKELSAFNSELDAKRSIELDAHKQELEKYFNNPEFMNTVQTYLKSDKPEIKQLGEGVMSKIATLREGGSLSDEDDAFLTRALPGNSFAPISELTRANVDRERDYQQQKSLIGYYQSLGDLRTLKQKGQLDISDITGIMGKIESFSQDTNTIETNPMYVTILEKYMKGKQLSSQEESLFMSYQQRLKFLNDGQKMLYGLLMQTGGKDKPTPESTRDENVPEDITTPKPMDAKEGPTGKEAWGFIKKEGQKQISKPGPVARVVGGAVEGITEDIISRKRKKEPKGTTAGVRARYNIPKGARIFTAKSLDDLKKLPGVKKNPPKSGDFVWTGDELHEIKVENGKITISKEAWKE